MTGRPRIGFLGVGWIGRHRMNALVQSGAVEASVICDPSADNRAEARAIAPHASVAVDLEDLLRHDLDGVVIATPSAFHAAQTIRCLRAGVAVFCQKPPGRDAGEVAQVVETARRADRLISADFSYRFAEAFGAVKALVDSGRLGKVFAIDATFHNAYGPDKPWYYDKAQAGGGCLVDLGVHLVDCAMWVANAHGPAECACANVLSHGASLPLDKVEDYAAATLVFGADIEVRLACSWRLHAGTNAHIELFVHGTEGGAVVRNVDGSFYDFEAQHFEGTARRVIASPPDDWGGRAACAWAAMLTQSDAYRPQARDYMFVTEALDRIYAAAQWSSVKQTV